MKHLVLIRFKIPATSKAIDDLCVRARAWLMENGLDGDWFGTAMLLRESLNNAVIHGSLNDASLHVNCELRATRGWLSILVEDGGPGFDWQQRRSHCARKEQRCGRGLEIYRLYADKVVFNKRGNRVLLRRRLKEGGQDAFGSD
jgi:serine/threonine-protein kinase RsbW